MARPRGINLPQTLIPVVGIAGLAAALILPGRHAPTEFQRVSAHPARFAGERVQVTGEVRRAPAHVPHGYAGAFVLAGPDGRRLLVVPPLGGHLLATRTGSSVTVRGTLVALQPSADDRRGHDTVVAVGDLAARAGARAILQAGAIAPS